MLPLPLLLTIDWTGFELSIGVCQRGKTALITPVGTEKTNVGIVKQRSTKKAAAFFFIARRRPSSAADVSISLYVAIERTDGDRGRERDLSLSLSLFLYFSISFSLPLSLSIFVSISFNGDLKRGKKTVDVPLRIISISNASALVNISTNALRHMCVTANPFIMIARWTTFKAIATPARVFFISFQSIFFWIVVNSGAFVCELWMATFVPVGQHTKGPPKEMEK